MMSECDLCSIWFSYSTEQIQHCATSNEHPVGLREYLRVGSQLRADTVTAVLVVGWWKSKATVYKQALKLLGLLSLTSADSADRGGISVRIVRACAVLSRTAPDLL